MATQIVAGSPMEITVLKVLLETKEKEGHVSNKVVREAARMLGKSERTVRRMINNGYVRKERTQWVPDETVLDLMHKHRGRVTHVHARLKEEGKREGKTPPVSVRTMQRAVKERCNQFHVANARGGYAAMTAMLPVLERDIPHRNDEWAIDHTLIPVFVLVDGAWCKPWMTTVLDAATRMVLAFTLSPTVPTLEETVETLAVAAEGYTTEDGMFVGGRPRALMSDRGGDLVTHAVTVGLLGHNVERRFTEAYTPHQNGRIERWHRTLKEEVCTSLPGYDRSDMTARDPRKAAKPLIDPRLLLPIEALRLELVKAIEEYNFDRQHSRLGGRTPFEAWTGDPTEIDRVDPAAIRASMTQHERRKVTRGQVRWDNRHYELPFTRVDPDPESKDDLTWREVLEGKFVTLRYLPTRVEFVEIETEHGLHVGRAWWTDTLDAEDAAKKLGVRRKAIVTARTSMNDRARAEADAMKALAARAAEIAEVEHDDETVDFGPRPDHRPEKKAPESSRKVAKKAAEKKRRDTTTEAVTGVVLARTGTDDLGF